MNNSGTHSKYFNYDSISYLSCFIAGLLYCLTLTLGRSLIQNIATIAFVIFLVGLFTQNLKEINKHETKSPLFIFIQLILLNLGIAAAAVIFASPDTFFWVPDSVQTHLPMSQGYAAYFLDHSKPLNDINQIPGISTHALTGLFIAIFGTSTFITILVQLIFKIIIVFFIYKTSKLLWNKKVGLVAIQLYGLCPTIFYYNLMLYKEGAVQAFVAMSIYFSLRIFRDKKLIFLPPLLLVLALLQNERFYIFYLLLCMYPFFIFDLPFKKNPKNIIIFSAIIAIGIAVFLKYYPQSMDISKIHGHLISKRQKWASYSDVLNQYNYGIPYPIAFLKIIFSPYFTPNKFRIFSDFSFLLIWGSMINQIIILASILGFIKALRVKFFHFTLWLPFILFLLFAAYISPWSGRLRDSFYPLIACYAAYYLLSNSYFQKFFKFKNQDSN